MSLFGRIEVIKTLAISRLVYILTLLPTHGKEYFQDIERMLYQFLWRNKPARIRATVIQNKIDAGGAGMTDLKVKNESLKLGWIERFITCPGNWKTPVLEALKLDIKMVEYFVYSNVHFNDLPVELKGMPFWSDVFYYWCKYNYSELNWVLPIQEVMSTNVWYNSKIKVNKKPIFWQNWYVQGVHTLRDLIKPNTNIFYTWEEFVYKYAIKGNYLHYYSLLHAIPNNWKTRLKGELPANLWNVVNRITS